jgi:demethylmenaquinone methyltransferase/2-methoxy-6-polyprenyl-1,4-benzoquinol methylase
VSETLPEIVRAAGARAQAAGFTLSCEPEVGQLLAALAATLPPGAQIAELGTGAGVGTAWILHGLGERRDVALASIELDPALHAAASNASWGAPVQFLLGDGVGRLRELPPCALIFADAPSGKLQGLDTSIDCLAPRGMLLVDDMDLSRHDDAELVAGLETVRTRLLSNPLLLTVELDLGSGVILSVRR